MTRTDYSKRAIAAAVAVVLLALLHVLALPLSLPGALAVYAVLGLAPGMVVCLLLLRRPRPVDMLLSAVIVSPLVTAAVATLLLLAGVDAARAATSLVVLWSAAGLWAVWSGSRRGTIALPTHPSRTLLLSATILVFCVLAAYLPLSNTWWRSWADAWFHGAVVAQIDDFGIPPEDPYFAGMELQYMWFYHVLIITLAKGTHWSAMQVMPVLNQQALAGFALGAFLLARRLRGGFVYGFMAVVTVMLALNAGVWFFLPLKVARSLFGEIRGWDEIARNFTLVPFDKETATQWVDVFFNQTFLLNKFIVSTAFSLGLCYMSVLWYAVIRCLDRCDRAGVLFAFAAVAGMLLFHPIVAVVMLAMGIAVLAMLTLLRRSIADFSPRPLVAIALAALAALVLTAPYLYSVTHLKEGEQLFPVSLSARKSAGILISCSLALALAVFQVKRMWRDRTSASYALLLGATSMFALCNIVQLPASNTYDKLPFFAFFPLAVIGSWTFADRLARPMATPRFRRRVIALIALLLVPLNLLMTAAYYNTSPKREVGAAEQAVARWVAGHTPREAVFLDSNDRVFLLVTGPRRYYWGRQSYAEQWGYPKAEMDKRKAVRDNIYSTEPITVSTFRVMADLQNELYVIARDGEPGTGGSHRLLAYPEVFREEFREDGIAVFSVDRGACLQMAATGPKEAQ